MHQIKAVCDSTANYGQQQYTACKIILQQVNSQPLLSTYESCKTVQILNKQQIASDA